MLLLNPLPGEGGAHPEVLEPLFASRGTRQVDMPSGRRLEVVTGGWNVRIVDVQNPSYHFISTWLRRPNGLDAVTFNIDNMDRLGQNQRHPDIYPAWLMGRTISFFEQLRYGEPLDCILAQWIQDGRFCDNYVQYQTNRARGVTKKQALLRTWTGRQAVKLGFGKPATSFIEDGLLTTPFMREGI